MEIEKLETTYVVDLDYVLDRTAVTRLQNVVLATALAPSHRLAEAEYIIKAVKRHHRNLNKIRTFIATCPVEMEKEVKI